MLIDATTQSKNLKRSTRRGHKRSTSRQKGPNGAPAKVPKNTFGRQPVHGIVGQISAVLVAVCACKKTKSETTNGAPEKPEVLPKRSTSKSNQRAQTKHQQVQSETTNGAPERPEVLPKWSTSKSNQRAQTKHQKVQSETKTEHQRDQRFCQNGAPASPIREHKRSTRKYNQRPQTEH